MCMSMCLRFYAHLGRSSFAATDATATLRQSGPHSTGSRTLRPQLRPSRRGTQDAEEKHAVFCRLFFSLLVFSSFLDHPKSAAAAIRFLNPACPARPLPPSPPARSSSGPCHSRPRSRPNRKWSATLTTYAPRTLPRACKHKHVHTQPCLCKRACVCAGAAQGGGGGADILHQWMTVAHDCCADKGDAASSFGPFAPSQRARRCAFTRACVRACVLCPKCACVCVCMACACVRACCVCVCVFVRVCEFAHSARVRVWIWVWVWVWMCVVLCVYPLGTAPR